jgi:hypothetical protein
VVPAFVHDLKRQPKHELPGGALSNVDGASQLWPRGNQLGKRLFGLVQGRADDPVATALRPTGS